jgi:hypothetical protein
MHFVIYPTANILPTFTIIESSITMSFPIEFGALISASVIGLWNIDKFIILCFAIRRSYWTAWWSWKTIKRLLGFMITCVTGRRTDIWTEGVAVILDILLRLWLVGVTVCYLFLFTIARLTRSVLVRCFKFSSELLLFLKHIFWVIQCVIYWVVLNNCIRICLFFALINMIMLYIILFCCMLCGSIRLLSEFIR